MKKLMSNVFRIVIYLLVSLMIGVNVYNINANKLAGNRLPMPFGYGCAVVLSGSMEPTISVGDMLIIKKTNDYQIHDVIVFDDQYELITHRIIDITKNGYITQGDANNVEDGEIQKTLVRGEVILVIPMVGTIALAFKNPFVVLVGLILAWYLVEASYKKEKKNNNDELLAIYKEIQALKEELKEED